MQHPKVMSLGKLLLVNVSEALTAKGILARNAILDGNLFLTLDADLRSERKLFVVVVLPCPLSVDTSKICLTVGVATVVALYRRVMAALDTFEASGNEAAMTLE